MRRVLPIQSVAMNLSECPVHGRCNLALVGGREHAAPDLLNSASSIAIIS
jgi:hypothetical protein